MLQYNFEYDKLKLKQITLLVPKNSPSLKTLLTPVLGLYGLDVLGFISVCEKLTSHISNDVTVPLSVKITKIKTFEVNLLTPYTGNLMSFYNSSEHSVDDDVLILYKFFLLKSIILSSFFTRSLLIYKNIRNYLLGVRYDNKVIQNVKQVPDIPKNLDNFGLMINFVNVNNEYLNVLKNLAIIYDLKVSKLNNYLISSQNFRFKSNNYVIGSDCWENFFKFLNGTSFNSTIGFLPLCIKYRRKLLGLNFFRKFFLEERFNKTFFLKLLFYQFTKNIKLNARLNILPLNLICQHINK